MNTIIRLVGGSLKWSTVLLSLGMLPAAAPAQHLSITGGAGVPGDIVQVSIALSGDATATAVTADLDIAFPADLVDVIGPVNTSCQVAERLQDTHQVGGRLAEPGLLRFALFARALEIRPLGNGELATCEFTILDDAPSTVALLTPEYLGLGDRMGALMSVQGSGGTIEIGDAQATAPTEPAPTPTAIRLCSADCDEDGVVTLSELILSINILLGHAPIEACHASDENGDSAVSVGELLQGVGGALGGCPGETPM